MSDPQEFKNITDPRFPYWVKGSKSGPNDGCVEISSAVDGSGDVALADSKAGPTGPIMVFNRTEWDAFLAGAEAGEFKHI